MDRIDCVVVGAGAVGLAIARALALDGREVLVVERETRIGTGVSSRSSEVIHAGLYYPPGSLKARLCVAGRDRLWAYCAAHGVEARRCGKLILAVSTDQIASLDAILDTATQNGVDDLRLLDGAEARRLESALTCEAALLSPSTGIFDSDAYMLSLQGDSEARGAAFAFGTTVTAIRLKPGRLLLSFDDAATPALEARLVVNAAGLHAGVLAKATEGLAPEHAPEIRLAKGSYFALSGRTPFTHLIYPRPEPGGLGVHLTLDLGGGARFGPDVEWVDHPDYVVDPALAPAFYRSVRTWWPGLENGRLTPAYAGIRPKLSGPGEPTADFRIDGPETHGVPGLINLFGIESPGLTASLALADEVLATARKSLDS